MISNDWLLLPPVYNTRLNSTQRSQNNLLHEIVHFFLTNTNLIDPYFVFKHTVAIIMTFEIRPKWKFKMFQKAGSIEL